MLGDNESFKGLMVSLNDLQKKINTGVRFVLKREVEVKPNVWSISLAAIAASVIIVFLSLSMFYFSYVKFSKTEDKIGTFEVYKDYVQWTRKTNPNLWNEYVKQRKED